ncbi:MAG TPA: hypothetical protein VID03_10435 [Acidimicrobiia bacterium]|jgi:hypothetical protein
MLRRIVAFFLILGAIVFVSLLAGVGSEVLMHPPAPDTATTTYVTFPTS